MNKRTVSVSLATMVAAGLAAGAAAFAQDGGALGELGGPSAAPRAAQPMQSGNSVIRNGEVFIAVGTRSSQRAAVIFAREYAADFPSVAVARLNSGRWATLVGWLPGHDSGAFLARMRQAGRIPNGSSVVRPHMVDELTWAGGGQRTRTALRIPSDVRTSPLLKGLGITGMWASSANACSAGTGGDDLAESAIAIDSRRFRWGTYGNCRFGSIVRVRGGVYLDAICGSSRNDRFVMSLRRRGSQLEVVTDPVSAKKMSYRMQYCAAAGNFAGGSNPDASGRKPDAAPQPVRPRRVSRSLPNTGGVGEIGGPSSRGGNPRVARLPDQERPRYRSGTPGDGNPIGKARSTGSGFFVNAKGHIVTNEHVVRKCDRVFVKGFGEAQVIRQNREVDLALLKVSVRQPVPFIKLRVQPVQLGQDVVVFGYPLSSILNNGLNVTTGVISSETGLRNNKGMLQFTAAIQPGNSGGPIVDRSGNLVAVVRSKFSDTLALRRGKFVPQNLNFGIRTHVLKPFLERNGVKPAMATVDKAQTVAELAAAAKKHTLLISCH